MVCAPDNCFCRKKGEINFTQSDFKNMDKQQTPYSSGLPAAVMKPVQYRSCFSFKMNVFKYVFKRVFLNLLDSKSWLKKFPQAGLGNVMVD